MYNTEKLSQFRTAVQAYSFNLALRIYKELDTHVQELFDIVIEPGPPGRETYTLKLEDVLVALVYFNDTATPHAMYDFVTDSIIRDIDRISEEVTEEEVDDEDDVVEGEEAAEDEEEEFSEDFGDTEWDPDDDEELDLNGEDEDEEL